MSSHQVSRSQAAKKLWHAIGRLAVNREYVVRYRGELGCVEFEGDQILWRHADSCVDLPESGCVTVVFQDNPEFDHGLYVPIDEYRRQVLADLEISLRIEGKILAVILRGLEEL
jgi:hypothetical protein